MNSPRLSWFALIALLFAAIPSPAFSDIFIEIDITDFENGFTITEGASTEVDLFYPATSTSTIQFVDFFTAADSAGTTGLDSGFLRDTTFNSIVGAGSVFTTNSRGDIQRDELVFRADLSDLHGTGPGARFEGGPNVYLGGITGSLPAIGTSGIIEGDLANEQLGRWFVVGDTSSTAVPEPSSLALMAMGAAGVAAWRMRRKSRVERKESSEKTTA